ncbi:Similar to Probable GTP-binding protein EngB; acc. no. Q6G2G5 [Pyronema omphalodes CBS 100304]|uniref:GTP-binding protein 8 n=1 Tax=Pyronema omphalodes (strain CBS 100304) TaxID=1076935 RepID=U4LDL8_PYROM|nr:Similar to Probable GTP-binding protein EngB; acc. no. Q6G2G5 [Pyronema omphalodes CBS 100304]
MGEKTSRPAQSEKNRKEEKAAAERGEVREDDVLVQAVRPEKKGRRGKGAGLATVEEDMMTKFNPRAEPTEMELEAMKEAGLRPRPEVRDMLGEVITEGLEGNLDQELQGGAGGFTGELKGKKGLVKGMTENIYRWDTEPPTGGQLKRADKFFKDHPVKHLWTEARFREIEMGESPEVAFLGRSNVGKSTLLNSLLEKGLAQTSSKPGKTRLFHAYGVNQGKIVLLDMPGYGHASREAWGVEIMKYLTGRKQLRRAYVLIDSQHGPKASDLMILESLGRANVPYQIVLSKIDRYIFTHSSLKTALLDTKYLLDSGIGGVSGLGEIIGVSSLKKKMGISELRWSIMSACGLEGWRKG